MLLFFGHDIGLSVMKVLERRLRKTDVGIRRTRGWDWGGGLCMIVYEELKLCVESLWRFCT